MFERALARRVFVAFGLLAIPVAPAGAAAPRLGDPAPELTLEEIFDIAAGATVDPEVLRGKALVVEFWATWCRPCVAALEHWNRMADELAGEPIVFLSVTVEDGDVVHRFLDGRRIAGLVGLDPDGSTFHDFGVNEIPHTALLDRDGVLRAETLPTSLTVASLRDLVAGRPIRLASSRSFDERAALALEGVGPSDAVLLAVARPAADPELRGLKTSASEYLAFGWLPVDAIAAAFESPQTRLVIEAELPEERFDFLLRTPDGRDRMELLREVVEQVFSVRVSRENRRRWIRVLGVRPGTASGLRVATGGQAVFATAPGSIHGHALDMATFANALEAVVAEPVIDETGLEGRFDIALDWDPASSGGLERALAAFGLELAPAQRRIELLVVTPLGSTDEEE